MVHHKVRDFVQGYINHFNKENLPSYIKEQAALRAFLCSECLDNTKCLVCNCATPAMFLAPLKKDSKNRWAEFFSEHQGNALSNNYEQYAAFFRHLHSTNSAVLGSDSDSTGSSQGI